jgi:hypothetical protein
MADGENTPRKTAHLKAPWQPGQSGNPAGRPKGSRNKLAEEFLADVLNEWEAHGATAVSEMREKSPGDFVKMVASLLPKDVNLNINDNLGELSDDELLGQLRELTGKLAPLLAVTDQGTEASGGAQIASRVH